MKLKAKAPTTTTRRRFLVAVPAVAAVGAGFVGLPASAHAAPSAELLELYASCVETRAAYERLDDEHDAALAAMDAELGDPPATILAAEKSRHSIFGSGARTCYHPARNYELTGDMESAEIAREYERRQSELRARYRTIERDAELSAFYIRMCATEAAVIEYRPASMADALLIIGVFITRMERTEDDLGNDEPRALELMRSLRALLSSSTQR